MAADRLLRAVLSFYREEPDLWQRLEPLLDCRLSRSWGGLRVACLDREHRDRVSAVLDLLRPPVLALRLGRQITLVTWGHAPLSYPAQVPLTGDTLA